MSTKSFVIIIPSYNNSRWYRKNLQSAISQNYSNFRIVYTDDHSSDNTGNLVGEFLKENDKTGLVKLIKNNNRIGSLNNLYNMIHSCDDNEIIVTLDGDDWFPHSDVLSTLNVVYNDDVWMTYGQYRSYPDNRIGCSKQIPIDVINNCSYRSYQWCSSHLRTFYAWLFKLIKKEDLQHNGKFYPMAWDLPMMFPMLEMSGHHHRFLNEVLYIYNYDSPINDAKVNLALQEGLEAVARSKQKYELLNNRP
jgi:glycosyltransferase involved in cell wall biosynthesis